jgi:carbon-monoxide dehydrogenase small subunit
MQVSLTVNGQPRTLDVPDNTLLVELLRQHLRLTGTHVGCDTSQCGACTVHLDGQVVKACNVFAAQAEGGFVTTIEGIGTPAELHPMQAAFKEHHGLQCGFCTPGMIMTAIGIADRHAGSGSLDEATVRAELDGNLCRCTGYHNIVRAVLDGAAKMKEAAHG